MYIPGGNNPSLKKADNKNFIFSYSQFGAVRTGVGSWGFPSVHVSGLVCESSLCCTGIVANPVRVASIRFNNRLRRSYGVQRGLQLGEG